ncbi:hypothetical protein DFH07DRAFT_438924 [Mycena maculata]|uniref:Uncharacterized protein n=1 Tax=Mycena maculata TaxID=230809 RepID=A0AAD7K8U6_9AGAR|nr:hypothetical protein DFH07DRAFT_438924 [Mycena maculata]
MARKKDKKPKEMFKPYDPDSVPDIMPFPDVAWVASTQAGEIVVPKLNEYQRSWILDIAIRNSNLPNLSNSAAKDLYDRVKINAFDAKAFQHTEQPGDLDEEARLPRLVASWKQQKNKPSGGDEGAGGTNDGEENSAARVALLRGYKKAGWRLVRVFSFISTRCEPIVDIFLK